MQESLGVPRTYAAKVHPYPLENACDALSAVSTVLPRSAIDLHRLDRGEAVSSWSCTLFPCAEQQT